MNRYLQFGLFLAIMLWGVPAFATITCVQGATGCTNTSLRTCNSASGTSCNISTVATTAGNIGAMCGNGNSATNLTAASTGGTWTVVANSRGSTGSDWTECEYILSLTGGVTTVTCTVAATAAFDCEFFEFSITNSPSTFDTSANGSDGSCTSCNGVALTLANSNNHILIQSAFNVSASWSAINQSYNASINATTGNASAYKLATAAGTTPAWTSTSTTAAVGGIAIYEAAPSATIPWYKLPTSGPSWAILALIGLGIGSIYGETNGISKGGVMHGLERVAGNHTGPRQLLAGFKVIDMVSDTGAIYEKVSVQPKTGP